MIKVCLSIPERRRDISIAYFISILKPAHIQKNKNDKIPIENTYSFQPNIIHYFPDRKHSTFTTKT